MSLKLRELWDECEKMNPLTFGVFLDGLKELAESIDKRFDELSQKACVAQKPSVIRNCGTWEPQEDDLLHQCVSRSRNPHQGFVSFANDVANKKRRTKDAAQQRYYDLVNGSKF